VTNAVAKNKFSYYNLYNTMKKIETINDKELLEILHDVKEKEIKLDVNPDGIDLTR
jgi:hypothetical protein